MNLNIKSNKAITLIALVITIIVLLILAGITTNVLFGNDGIFTKSQEAKENTAYAVAKEKLDLALASLRVEKMEEYCLAAINTDINKHQKDVQPIEWKEPYTSIIVRVDGKYDFEIFGNGMILQLKQYNINYVLNGGILDADSPKLFKNGTKFGLKKATKEGAEFGGWYSNSECTGAEVTKIINAPNADITLYAKWIDETNQAYFVWSENSETLLGFSTLGLEKYNNNEITSLIIPKKHNGVELINIAEEAFVSKTKLKTVIIPNSVESIYASAFGGCSGVENLQMPISANQFVDGVYYHNAFTTAGLKNLRLTCGNGVERNCTETSSRWLAWGWSSNEMEITLDEGIEKVGDYLFYKLTKSKFNLPCSLESIGNYAFYNCYELSGDLDLTKIKDIGNYAFYRCSKITGTIDLTNVETVGNNSFNNCIGIEKLIIPDTMITLGKSSFVNCSGIKSLKMPIGLDMFNGGSVGDSALFNCTGLTEVILTPGQGTVFNYNENGAKWTPWKYSKDNNLTIILEEGIKTVGSYTFHNCTNAKFNLPSTLETVNAYAFAECKGEIKASKLCDLKVIGDRAFSNCTGLIGELNFTRLQDIGTFSFCNCTGITKVVIPDDMTVLGEMAFFGCTGITSLKMPIGINMFKNGSLADEAFALCSGLTEVRFTYGPGLIYNMNVNSATRTPWYRSRANNLVITFEKGIRAIGTYNFYDLNNVTFNYTGNADDWSKVAIGENNPSLTSRTVNYI